MGYKIGWMDPQPMELIEMVRILELLLFTQVLCQLELIITFVKHILPCKVVYLAGFLACD